MEGKKGGGGKGGEMTQTLCAHMDKKLKIRYIIFITIICLIKLSVLWLSLLFLFLHP
jgi:hypothetical protein